STPLPPPGGAMASAPQTQPAYRAAPEPRGYDQGYGRGSAALPPPPAQSHYSSAPAAAGGTTITVGPHDTIEGLERRYGISAFAIAEANNLPNGSTLRSGQRLIIPRHDATGSATPRP